MIEQIEQSISEMVQSYEEKLKFLEHENKEIKQQLDDERNNHKKLLESQEFKELIPSNDIDIDKEIPTVVNVLKPSSEKLSIMDSMNNLKLMISQMKLEMKDEFEEGSNDDDFDSFE
ncbi:hypothetical protein ENUP19_0359G0023 [Entamoeba nuttalli]|uniref:Uncharacterized protein n=1 Tax=Entamoeba nuttalli TaxID=412467 RepID=A0ABQ0DY90_9EUKA